MGKIVFGMMQSLDGYIDIASDGPHIPPPGPILHRHFNDHLRGLAGILYGRRMYEVMRYWDEDRAGPDLAESLTTLGLIDEYRLYLRPIVLGRGKPFLAGPRPPLRLVASDLIVEDVMRLTYVPA